MFFMFEFGRPVLWKPGIFKSRVSGKRYYRAWWLWFAITIYFGDFQRFRNAIESGDCEWRDQP
jgi:hypothetical protein